MVGRRVLGEGKGRNKKEAEQAAARDALDRVGGRTSDRERPERAERAESSEERRGGRDRGVVLDEPLPRRVEREPAELETTVAGEGEEQEGGRRRRGRRGGRGRRERAFGESARHEPGVPPVSAPSPAAARSPAPAPRTIEPSSPFALPPEDGRFERLRREAERDAESDVEVVEVEPIPSDHEDDDYEEVGRPEGPLEERHVDPYAALPPVIESRPRPEPVEPASGSWASDEGADAEPELAAAERELAEEFEPHVVEPEAFEKPEASSERPASPVSPAPSAPPPSPPPVFGRRPGRSRRGGR
jgi:ribonuclease E